MRITGSFIRLIQILLLLTFTLTLAAPPKARPRREDTKYIACQTCRHLAASAFIQAQDLHEQSNIKEESFIELMEKITTAWRPEGEWITTLHITPTLTGRSLQLKNMKTLGECGEACKTIERAAQEVLGEHDTDVAEALFVKKFKSSDALTTWLCERLTSSCAHAPPVLPQGHVPYPPFSPMAPDEQNIDRVMGEMADAGLKGQMWSREELMDKYLDEQTLLLCLVILYSINQNMVSRLPHVRGNLRLLGTLMSDWTMQIDQRRGIRLFEIFSKEKREERRAKLKEEMQRGYFDDFKDFRGNQGKVFLAPEKLIPAAVAPVFPPTSMLTTEGNTVQFPSTTDENSGVISLVCIAFRAGAQEMIESWAVPFSREYPNNERAALIEIALIESIIMRLYPFRSILMKNGGASQSKYAMQARYLYHFGDAELLRAALGMTNRLTGYVYLVDQQGRVRWRGSGHPTGNELENLFKLSEQLLDE